MGLGPHNVTAGLDLNEIHVAPRQRCQITDLALWLRSYQCFTRWDSHIPGLTGKLGSRKSIEKEGWREWGGKAGRRGVMFMSRRHLPSWAGVEDLRSHRRGHARTHPDLCPSDSSPSSQTPQPLAQVLAVQAAALVMLCLDTHQTYQGAPTLVGKISPTLNFYTHVGNVRDGHCL